MIKLFVGIKARKFNVLANESIVISAQHIFRDNSDAELIRKLMNIEGDENIAIIEFNDDVTVDDINKLADEFGCTVYDNSKVVNMKYSDYMNNCNKYSKKISETYDATTKTIDVSIVIE